MHQTPRSKKPSVGRLRAILSDRRGAAAVEFGLVCMPFFAALFAVFEIGYSFFMVSALDHATQTGARAVMTGAVSTSSQSAATFRTQVICPALPSNFNCNNVFVNLITVPQAQSPSGYYSFVNANLSGLIHPPLSALTTFCPGAGGQYLVLQVLYPVAFFTGFFAVGATTNYNGQKVHVLMSTATFKSEPYSGAAAYAGC